MDNGSNNGNDGKQMPVTITVAGPGTLTNWSIAKEIAALLEGLNANVTVKFNKSPRIDIGTAQCIQRSAVTVQITNEN
jgi:hypothetical protein